ncbi:expressed unknown protein [Seminavis robusta]|uniref:Sulfotransferase domain-containing protein n=1 Tax=Seminavis robusta TaxID=568900 RepID=A0A9N8DD09_9STRA|nr:expressed unknown protein [Seminavis robusta]|eukprot:Sro97_g050110.1 n/a (428) ;mRNA; r:95069-96352
MTIIRSTRPSLSTKCRHAISSTSTSTYSSRDSRRVLRYVTYVLVIAVYLCSRSTSFYDTSSTSSNIGSQEASLLVHAHTTSSTTAAKPPPLSFPPPLTCSLKQQEKLVLPPTNHALRLTSNETKLVLLGTAKGGATLATQILLRKVGLYETAVKYHPWIHNYRSTVYETEHPNQGSCQDLCGTSTRSTQLETDWLCLKLVRSPLDRIVSSYVHVLRTDPQSLVFPELDQHLLQQQKQKQLHSSYSRKIATFADFVAALELRLQPAITPITLHDVHFMLQTSTDGCDRVAQLVPIEAIDSALAAIHARTGVALNATGLTSSHYVVVANTNNNNKNTQSVIHTPYSDLSVAAFPHYDQFLQDTHLNARICALFCLDFQLYAKACTNPTLLMQQQQSTPHYDSDRRSVATVCAHERNRIRTVCGDDYDFF